MFKKLSLIGGAVFVLAGCAQIGALALKLMTSKEKDLSKMAVVGMYQSNLYSKNIKTMGTDFAKYWEDGKSMVGLQFIKTEGYGVLDLEGTVIVGGDTAKSQGGGVYSVFVDKDDRSPKKIEIHSLSGQTSSFEISPAPMFTIKSINGKSSDYEVDLTKDLVLEFNLGKDAKGKLMLVSMISKMPGGQEFNGIQPFHAAEKVTIPAGSFKSTQVSGGGIGGVDVVKFITEGNYLKVDLIEEDRLTVEPHPYARRKSAHLETVPVKVTGEIKAYAQYRVDGEVDVKDEKPFKYYGSAANGYYAASLEAKKLRIGIASLGVSASLFKQTKDVSESKRLDGARVITTTITTYQFPQLDDKYWDEYMKGIYDGFRAILTKYNVEVVDIDNVVADPNYEKFYAVEDKNNKELFRKNYKNSKRLSSLGLLEIGDQTATAGITDDLPKPKLIQSMNLDAVAYVNLNFTIGGDNNAVVLYPSGNVLIEGRNIVDKSTVQNWYSVSADRGKGVPFNEKEFTNVAALNRILQKDMILASFDKAISELVAKQREAQVAESWNVMLK
ncbi:hypothetical protein EP331_01630 [bacterium]|nr:MAG: hypothetical protein EP331_01630 [bacterium]